MAIDIAQKANQVQRAEYHADGFVVVRQLLSPERLEALDREAGCLRGRRDLIDARKIPRPLEDDPASGECPFACFDPVIALSDVCRDTAFDPRILDIVSTLYGEPACLFKDK